MTASSFADGMWRRRCGALCGNLQRVLGWPAGSWEPVPKPAVITKRDELGRHFRYVSRNECRAGLARDPLETLWSTYREMFGAVADPWADAVEVMRRLGAPRTRSLACLHQFVSGDPSVAVGGTALPQPARFGLVSSAPLAEVWRAAATAHRTDPNAVVRRTHTRKTFVWLARATGWRQTSLLADICGVTPDAIRRIARHVDPRALSAAATCFGDPRLLQRIPEPHGLISLADQEKSRRAPLLAR